MLALGEQKISGLYLGREKIKRAYLGGAVVLGGQKPPRLPEGYTEVEYIQSGPYCTIPMGITTSAYYNFRLVMDFAALSIEGDTFGTGRKLFTASIGQTSAKPQVSFMTAQFSNRNDVITFYVGGGSISIHVAPEERHLLDVNLKALKLSFDGIDHSITRGGSVISSFTPKLFTDQDSEYSTRARLYSSQIYNADHLIRDFVPCISPGGETGVYDMVDGKFYQNESTRGQLIPGPPV